MKKKRLRKRWIYLLLLMFLGILIYGIVSLIMWKNDSDNIVSQIEEVQNVVEVEEVEDNENTEVIEVEESSSESNSTSAHVNIYWSYIKMNLISVNFEELKNINSDTVGWVVLEGTNINYPFVQTTDNSYYLKHDYNKYNNNGGWVFADYRNKLDGTDKNLIIYAHARGDGTMFGTLKYVISDDWFNNEGNRVVKVSTETVNTLWQVFSVYTIDNTNDYIKTDFASDSEYMEFLNMLQGRSKYDFGVSLSSNDRIITLSSCYSDSEKIVLHARLIKLEYR